MRQGTVIDDVHGVVEIRLLDKLAQGHLLLAIIGYRNKITHTRFPLTSALSFSSGSRPDYPCFPTTAGGHQHGVWRVAYPSALWSPRSHRWSVGPVAWCRGSWWSRAT